MSSQSNALRRLEGITSRQLGDETLVYDETTGRVHALPRDLGRVWQACSGIEDLNRVALLAGLSPEDTAAAIAQLDALGLLERTGSDAGFDRRRFLLRSGVVGVASMSASVLAPMAASASSALMNFANYPSGSVFLVDLISGGGGGGYSGGLQTGGTGGRQVRVMASVTTALTGGVSVYAGGGGGPGTATAGGKASAGSIDSGGNGNTGSGAGGGYSGLFVQGSPVLLMGGGGGGGYSLGTTTTNNGGDGAVTTSTSTAYGSGGAANALGGGGGGGGAPAGTAGATLGASGAGGGSFFTSSTGANVVVNTGYPVIYGTAALAGAAGQNGSANVVHSD